MFKFAAGLAAGYVLGSRAGREKYEQIVAAARKAQNHPAATQIRQKATQLLGTTPIASRPNIDPVPAVTSPTGTSSVRPDTEPAGATAAAARRAARQPGPGPATAT